MCTWEKLKREGVKERWAKTRKPRKPGKKKNRKKEKEEEAEEGRGEGAE